MTRRLVMLGLAGLWGLAVFFLALHLSFPSGAALKRLEWEVSSRSGGEWTLLASDAAPWRLSGLSLDDVELLKAEKRRPRLRRGGEEEAPEEAPAAKRVLALEALGARIRLLPLLGGDPDLGFAGRAYGGDLEGHVRLDGFSSASLREVSLDLSDLDLSRLPLDGERQSFELGGLLDVRVDLDLDPEDPTKATGSARLEARNLILHKGEIAGFGLPEESPFNTARVVMEVKDGKARITDGRLAGDLVDATLEGDITLNRKLSRSRLKVQITLTLTPDLDNMVRLLPGPREARTDDGKYHFLLTGTLQHPHFRPDSSRAGGSRRRPPRPGLAGPMAGPEVGAGAGAGDMDDEERRQLREERRRQREERLRARREEARKAREEEVLDGEEPEMDDEEYHDGPPDELLEDEDFGPPPGFDDVDLRRAPPFEGEEGFDDPDEGFNGR